METVDVVATDERRLSRILHHALTRVPFYGELRRSLGDNLPRKSAAALLAAFPVLTKETYRSQQDALIDAEVDRSALKLAYTSGSTGVATPVRTTEQERVVAYRIDSRIRRRLWGGLWTAEPMFADLTYAEQQGAATVSMHGDRMVIQLAREWSSATILQEATAALSRFGAQIIRSNPRLLLRLATAIEEGSAARVEPAPYLIESTHEFVSKSELARIESAFRCPLANVYGCQEVYLVAFGCPRGGMHINTDSVTVEMRVPAEGAQLGELLVTSHVRTGLPIVRYEIGDVVATRPKRCSCGAEEPVIDLVPIRMADRLAGYPEWEGRRRCLELIRALSALGQKEIMDFRVVQKATDRLEVLAVPGPDYTSSTAERIRAITEAMAPSPQVAITTTATIELHPSLKRRRFLSEV